MLFRDQGLCAITNQGKEGKVDDSEPKISILSPGYAESQLKQSSMC
jgi:hypothetical protein